ncbi:citrate/2-methylcitrate synthase [Frankia sp. AgB32]|uniref:citrate/2-methylcitrate synthase n=1 Tax=Frankia sp. AgB32 TaxID=631119 RepID=UPI00200C5250|nr:citrate/2-methylcitrate synthase [Frankia sp. AgB32]MCK9894167.1 MerR family transcriptional regulator [Frankia sp. AgB32]
MVDGTWLTSREVAERLGVKVETVYAYASRGLLHSRRGPGGRGSTFDPAEVARLRQVGRARPDRADPPEGPAGTEVRSAGVRGAGLPVIRTRLTAIADGRLHYRGRDAVELVAGHSFEQVAGWLWLGRLDAPAPFAVPEQLATTLRHTGLALPARARLTDRLRVAVSVAAADDPLRFDLQPDSVILTARTLVAALVEAIPASPVGGSGGSGGPAAGIAGRLWERLTATPAEPAALACLDHALGLLADHDLAVSTFAARVAASARADPYAVVSAGLAALDGPLHGGASRLAARLVSEVSGGGDAIGVVSERLRSGQPLPGFGHAAYPDGDPRAQALLRELAEIPTAAPFLATAEEITRASGRDRPQRPNVDLALAVLTLAAGMPAEAGEVIFAVARTVGWLAHALEEYGERPLRLRPRGVYVGPPPAREIAGG